MRDFVFGALSLCLSVYLAVIVLGAITSPAYQDNWTARYSAWQAGETARVQAREETERVRTREWGDTARTWGQWGAGGLVAVVAVGAAGYGVVQWQRERTRRHVASEENATRRALIAAQRDVAMQWIAAFGTPGSYAGQLPDPQTGRVLDGVFVPERRQFVALDACRAQLEMRKGNP